jgi:predicted dehydrogenase
MGAVGSERKGFGENSGMGSQVCRFGIMGTATIARKNWQAIHNSGNTTLVAVGSRSRERAEKYIGECQASVRFDLPPKALTYEELLASPEIDAVYIPLPTGVRKEWVIRAAQAKKHVLCEKPCAVHAADLAEMLAVCRASNVQFMDGVMFMHSARLASLRQTLDDGTSVGQIKRIVSHFSFRGSEEFVQQNIRVNQQLEPLGCLGDLGWYNIRFTLWAMNYKLPRQVSGRLLSVVGESGTNSAVPTEFSGELLFEGGVSASFYCSFITEHQQWANIGGTKGFVHVPDFVVPFYGCETAFTVTQAQFDVRGCQFNMNDHTRRVAVREYSNNGPDSQETNLFRNFATLATSGRPDPTWGEIALKTQHVLDACLLSSRQEGVLVALGQWKRTEPPAAR